MKKTGIKSERGVTLVILVITIILLLILSSIELTRINKKKFTNKAKNVANETNTLIDKGQNDIDQILNEWNNMNIDRQENTLNVIQ